MEDMNNLFWASVTAMLILGIVGALFNKATRW